MARTTIQQIALTASLLLAAGAVVLAQGIASPNESPDMMVRDDDLSDASASYIIFSNLSSADDRYSTIAFDAKPIVGKQVSGVTEEWNAIRFVPKVDVQAQVLEAAIGYSSGTRLIRLGIFNNDTTFNPTGTPGTVLPGAQGSTEQIPDLGDCCQVARVTLAVDVNLTAGTTYWLVASTDDTQGADFSGAWQVSHLGESAYLESTNPWNPQPGEWPAARIRGTRLQTVGPVKDTNPEATSYQMDAVSRKITIFSNITRAFPEPYFPGFGNLIIGNSVPLYDEVSEAIPFTPKKDVIAKTLAAAIAHTSGTKGINLGIFSDSGGLPGTLLPGGQASTSDIPDSGECCDLATVRLPGIGVALSGKVQYWLVASPDNVNAPDFMGIWQDSTNNLSSQLKPEQTTFWGDFTGLWSAAQITGSNQ